MVMAHTRDLEKLLDNDSTSSNEDTAKSLKARYKKLFTIQKESTLLQVCMTLEIADTKSFVYSLFWWQNQLEDKDLQLEDSDKARKVAAKKLMEWEAELINSKHEISTLCREVSSKLKF